jgi:hypothetical protein
MKHIIMAFGALAIAGAVPALAQDATMPPPPAPDATTAPPAAPTPPAADGSMAPAQPGSAGGTSSGGMSSGVMPSSSMQSPMPSATTGPLPKCTAKIKDRCDQSATSERYALSADQAMKTGGVGDRRSDRAGGDAAMGKPTMKKHMMHHKMMHHKMMHQPAAEAAPTPTTM